MKPIPSAAFPALTSLALVLAPSPSSAQTLTVLEQGPHHKIIQTVTATTEPDGSATVQTNTYTQLETGLSYLDGTGQYRDAVAEFEVVPGAAVAQRTQHKVVLAANANTDEAVELWMPDGEKLVSHVLGLGYFDRATGKSVVIAELKDSEGVLSESKDQVLYPDCFTLGGTLRYRLTKYGLEQDVILTEQPPAPEDYGLSSEFAQLQIITEFVKHPKPALNARVLSKEVDPEKRKALAEPDVLDDTIDFPTIQIGSGRAFALSEEQPEIDPGQGVAVAKSWQTIEGRTVLFEEVSYGELKPALEKLPARPQANVGGKRKPVASLKRALPQVRLAKKDTAKVIQVAEARLPNKGVVVDYQATLVDSTGFTFRADTTYRVTGTVNLSGTTTIEAGTVLKYDAVSTAMVICNGPIICQTTSYRPAIFTSKDDNSVGETISGSTGSPTGPNYANPALQIKSINTQLHDLRIAYAQKGLFFFDFSAGNGNVVSHAQLVHCGTAFQFNGYGITFQNFAVRNVLIHDAATAFYGYSFSGTIEHLTVDQCTQLANDYNGQTYGTTSSLSLMNSLLVAVGSYYGVRPVRINLNAPYTQTASSGSGIFQSVGAGYHYLPDPSPYRNAGSASINGTLAAELKKLTTSGPVTLTSVPTDPLAPQAPRDTDTPDLGYHYAPLDYLCSQMSLGTSTVTLTNGVAIGLFGNYGFSLVEYSVLNSEGLPGAMNRLVWYPSVQEQPIRLNNISIGSRGMFYVGGATSPSVGYTKPIIKLRFTDLVGLGRRQVFFDGSAYPYLLNTVSLTDCWLRGIDLTVGNYPIQFISGNPVPMVTVLNNLVERGTVSLFNGYLNYVGTFYQNPLALSLYNNLLWNSTLSLRYDDFYATYHPAWSAKDNLFDTATISFTGDGSYQSYVSRSNNGFTTGTVNPLGGTANQTDLTPDYRLGPLGNYYYPPSGGGLARLINVGSRTAPSAGLFHFTASTTQQKEGLSTVDIGFHYVAVDNNGVPWEADEPPDGVADYLADRNGNGVVDPQETA